MLTADDGGVSNNFGWSVAIDGDNAVISAPAAPVGANALQGKAYIFHADAGNFIQGPTLLADDGTAFASFGYSVAIDGVTAVIGAQGVDSYFGAAYVFDGADAWTQSGRLSPDDGTPLEFFGISVDVSGAVAIVGAYYQDVGDNDHQGAAYLFRNEGGTWTQSQKLTASDGAANDRFGLAVALDGSTAIVGAYIADVAGNVDQGAAYVFEASEGIFAEQAKLTASDGIAEAHYGNAVAVHDGTALIGDSAATVAGNVGQGAAYFYSAPVADRIFQSGFDFVP